MTSPRNASGIVTSTRMSGSKDHRMSPGYGILDRQRASDLERHFAGVDLVEGTVEEGHFHVDHRVGRRRGRFRAPSRMPWSIGLMYSRGMIPPTILSMNS